MNKNLGFKILSEISKIILGEEITMDDLWNDYILNSHQFRQLTWSFSVYKNMLADRLYLKMYQSLRLRMVMFKRNIFICIILQNTFSI